MVEIVAVARRRSAPRIRGLAGMQSLAGFLIGGIVLLAPTAASAATTTPAVAATPTVGGPSTTASATPTTTATPSTDFPTHTVATATETPWDLAETYLGNGQRWRDIAALNPDIPQLASGDQYLPPNTVLTLPPDARPTTPADAAGDIRTQLGDGSSAADTRGERVVTVHTGDYLSKIAAEQLGDGDAWPQLFEASKGTAQPHGLPAITDPDVIYAGQRVTVPATQPNHPSQGREKGAESGHHETTPPVTQKPDGDQKPGEEAGEKAPAPEQTTAPAPALPAPRTPTRRPAEQPGQDQASASATASVTPRPSASPSASAEPSGSAASSPAPAPEVPATAPAGSPLNLRIVLGAGALLAAAVTGALALRRTLQRRRRKPGEKIAIAPETSPAEAQLAAAAEPGGAARLDVALRTLAHHVAQQEEGAVVPALRAARIGTRAVSVLPEDHAQEPVAPFTAGQGGWWILPSDAALLDDDAARDVPAPYPGLVTIGNTKAGDLLLLNLTGLPALLLDGNPAHITEVCTSLALELGMSPWGTEVQVVAVGFGEDLPQLLPTTRITHLRQPAHALRDLSERLLEAHQMPETRHQPYLLLCASALDEDTAWQFADVISRAGTLPVTLIAPAGTAAARFPDAETLNASLSEPQHLDHAGTDITLQRLEHAAYQQITTALKVSGQPSHPAEGPWQDVPDELDNAQQPETWPEEPAPATAAASILPPAAATDVSGEVFPALLAASTDPSALRLPSPAPSSAGRKDETASDTEAAVPPAPASPASAAPTDAAQAAEADDAGAAPEEPTVAKEEECEAQDLDAPEIRVLGPVEVTGVDSTGHGPRMAQLASLLYFRPGRNADVLCADMDPVSPWSTSTLNARMQGLRSCLGSDPSGNLYIPRRKTGEDPYQLAPGVRCDWTRFLGLVERALPLGPSGLTDLEKALTLVRGKPFGGRPLPWAEPHAQEMTTRIIDVAHTVATHRTPAGPHHDLNAARHAVATGLEVDETAELMYRDWLRIESAAGNRQGLHTAITRIQQINRALDCDLEIETEQLINDLLKGTGSARSKCRIHDPMRSVG